MPVFQHVLWGYTLTYPETWNHQTIQGAEAFAAVPQALSAEYDGPDAGHVLVKAEWNSKLQPVEPIWERHIGMLASLMGARHVGSAPWQISGASGFETEIVFPKKENKRLWSGILARDFLVLKFMVMHPKEIRQQFEPRATHLIASLRFPSHFPATPTEESGLPIPPGYQPANPGEVLEDIPDLHNWRAYRGESSHGALQAFYLRESPAFGWQIVEFVPYPYDSGLNFARFKLHKGKRQVTLGILPYGEADGPANVAYKLA